MMTITNSIGLRPCQVAPMGIHHSSITTATATRTAAAAAAAAAPPSSIDGAKGNLTATAVAMAPHTTMNRSCGGGGGLSKSQICRNLFGASTKDENNRIFEKQMAKNEKRLKERYDYDVRASDGVGGAGEHTTKQQQLTINPLTSIINEPSPPPSPPSPLSPTMQSQAPPPAIQLMPSLIEMELLEHERKGMCNHHITTTTTTTNVEANNKSYKRVISINNDINSIGDNNNNNSSSNGRSKPYARQTHLTDSFNLRKTAKPSNRHHTVVAAASANVSAAAAIAAERTPPGKIVHGTPDVLNSVDDVTTAVADTTTITSSTISSSSSSTGTTSAAASAASCDSSSDSSSSSDYNVDSSSRRCWRAQAQALAQSQQR